MTRKARNTGYGSARWLGNEWVESIANGEPASKEAARELADEVRMMRRARRLLISVMWQVADMVRAKHGHHEADGIHGALCIIATSDEAYGRPPESASPTDEPRPCPPTDTPPSAESGDPPPRARSSG